MCGIVGFIDFDHKKDYGLNTIWDMLALQKHRGPDDSAVLAIDYDLKNLKLFTTKENQQKYSGHIFWGFNRLSILDLSINGRQPMLSEDEQVALMMNGEIYNAFEFKDDLRNKGHRFKSNTDTEIVLKLYLEYGMEDMIKKLNGMFAIAIWDMRVKSLFLARDRFGIKPLYILQEKSRLAFSSEIKSFGELPEFSFEIDKEKIDEFLLFRNVINNTLFKNIRNCTPGMYLSVNESGVVKEHVFFDLNEEGRSIIPFERSYYHMKEALQHSVHRQMISDVKLGCQLSGGVDSSLVTYFAQQSLKDDQLETISIKFSNPQYSEEKYIDEVADRLGLIAHKYLMSPEYYFKVINDATWHFEQPLNHPNTIGIYLLSQQAKKHVTVLLSGEGADEVLAGYDRFLYTDGFPYFNRYFLSGIKQNSNNLIDYLRCYNDAESRLIMESSFSSTKMAADLYPDFDLKKSLQKRKAILNNLEGNGILKHRKYEILTYLPDLLMRQDKMSMAHSIENRVPFLDNEMVSTSLRIPDKALIKKKHGKKEGKFLLKELCSKKFSNTFAFRRKQGFGIPLKEFMKTEVFKVKWFDEFEPGIKRRGIFNIEDVSKNILNLDKTKSIQLDAIWLMVGFEIWAKNFIDK